MVVLGRPAAPIVRWQSRLAVGSRLDDIRVDGRLFVGRVGEAGLGEYALAAAALCRGFVVGFAVFAVVGLAKCGDLGRLANRETAAAAWW
jgi:hypothetical protein